MTIRPGDAWGQPLDRHPSSTSAGDERMAIARWSTAPDEPVLLRSGSLRHAFGLSDRLDRPRLSVTCDVIRIESTRHGRTRVEHALGNVVVVGRGGRPTIWLATNTGWWRRRQVAPRSHPNDGLLDVLTVAREMSWPQRVRAFSRARRGDHVPHPALRVVRSERFVIEDAGACRVWVDGTYVGRADRLRFGVIPDAIEVHA